MKWKYIISVVEVVGICDFGVGASRFIEYLYGGEKQFIWKGEIGMSFSTAIVIMFTGIALILIAIYLSHREKIHRQV